MNENIKISVIIPIYNSQKHLCKCLDSVVNQTYKNLDIVLVDDGSTDGSGKTCDIYALKNSNIKVIHKENGGQSSARKAGMDYAIGDYITFMDSDDYIDIDAFEKILSQMDSDIMPEMIVYDLIEEYENHVTIKTNQFKAGVYDRNGIEKEILSQVLSFGSFFDFGILPNLVCKMIKRDYIQKREVDICHKVKFGEDADMVFQWLPFLKSIQIISYAPYHYNKRDDSMMGKTVQIKEIILLQDDLKKAFLKSQWKQCLLKQLEDYITFVLLLKAPDVILGENLCGGSSRIALYGAGGFGQSLYKTYHDSIIMWVDQYYEYYLKKGLLVSDVAKLIEKQEQYDVIYIAIINTQLCEEIRRKLIKCGIKKKIIYFEKMHSTMILDNIK